MVTEELENSYKQLALELLVTIAENAPAMMRKHAKFLPKIGQSYLSRISRISRIFTCAHMHTHTYTVTQALQFMLEVSDDEEWLTHDTAEESDDDTR